MPKVAEVFKSYPSFSQPYLVEGDDGEMYILKHSQGEAALEMLAGEYITTKFGVSAKVPVIDCTLIEVDDESLQYFQDCPERNGAPVPEVGIYLASRHKDGLPASSYEANFLFDPKTKVLNQSRAASVVAYDTLIQNYDVAKRNVLIVFTDSKKTTEYEVYLIDQGHAFLGLTWPALESPTSAWKVFPDRAFLFKDSISGMLSVLPTVERDFQSLGTEDIKRIVSQVPSKWGLSIKTGDLISNFFALRLPMFGAVISAELNSKMAS